MNSGRDTRWHLVLATVAIWTVVQVPFLTTAYRVDETNIIRIAERIVDAPGDPYGFLINWGGIDEDAFHILANPPGVPFWLALWGGLFGWSEWVLHLSMIPFGLISLLAFAVLARELGVSPLVSMLLMIASPAFFLAAQVVMPDIAMLAGFVAALAAAMVYRRTGSVWWAVLGFVAGALAPIFKYNGALVGPLLALVWLLSRERRKGLFVIMLGPAVGMVAWSWWSLVQYGRVHILTIAEFESGGATNILTSLLGFFGLGVLPLVMSVMRSPERLPKFVLNAVSVLSGVLMAFAGYFLLNAGPYASIGYGVGSAIGFRFALVWCALVWRWVKGRRDLENATLLLWVALVVWFQFGLLFASVRYMLPLVPAAILLLMRSRLVTMDRPAWRFGLAACLVLVLAVAIGDARTANLYRRFAREVAIPQYAERGNRFFFDGHWGFQYYMEEGGGRIMNFYRQPRWKEGDVLVIARVPFPSYRHPTPSKSIVFEETEYAWSPGWPVRTIDCSAWANFYGPGVMKCKGPALPFGFSLEAADEFAIYEARARVPKEEDPK